MSMYTLAKEIFPPTGIECVVRCNFVRPDVLNVIVAKSSLLEIYSFVEPTHADQLPRLELVGCHRLNGIITSLGVIRTSSSGQHGLDSILVSFKEAKMSLLEWSFSNHSLVTVSIHYYERDDYKQEFLNNTHPTEIRVDPSRRCAVLAFYGNRLAVLPFRQDEAIIGDEDDVSKKWPYMPSFVMSLSDIDIRIKNVIDMVFLYDFFEPTLAILFSPQQTWTGRLAVRKDTCSLVVVSLDITHRVYPVIYSIDQLPYDCTKIIAVPKPVGGLLVVSANALIHLDQGSSGMGVGVNGYAPLVTNYPLSLQARFEIALEGSNHVFLAPDQILFTLRSGDMYVVELQQEGRSLSGFKIEKAGTSMQTSCKCSLVPGYYFVGSRYADSMLIKYSTKDEVKRKKKSVAAVTSMDLDNELYGQDLESSAEQKTDKSKDEIESAMDAGESKWQFEICDTITNTGPIVGMDVGQRASNESHTGFSPQHELVAATGSGQNGALVVFQRNIRPNVVRSTDALAGATCLWTVFCRKEIVFEGVSQFESRNATSAEEGVEDVFDKLLIISKDTYTLVLATGDELRQLPSSQFYVEGPTVAVGSLLEDTRVVQVYASGVRLLNADCKVTQIVPIGGHLSIVAASIIDPYILLQLHDGSALLLKGDMTTKDVTILSQSSILNNVPIKSCCIFADTQNTILTVNEAPTMSSLRSLAASSSRPGTSAKPRRKTKTSSKAPKRVLDEVELDLYGPEPDGEDDGSESEEDADVDMEDASNDSKDVDMEDINSKAKKTTANPDGQSIQATLWCIIYRTDGSFEIYHLPDFKEVFFFAHFDLLPDVLSDAPDRQDIKPAGLAQEISEIVMVNMGTKIKKEPYLVVRTYRGNIAIYKTYQHFPTQELDTAGNPIDLSERLGIRFRKIPLDVVARETPEDDGTTISPEEQAMEDLEDDDTAKKEREIRMQQKSMLRRPKNLIPFSDVAGFSGVFVLGASPMWIMGSERGMPRVHPMICEGKIGCFTQFHNINCKNGFITSNAEGNVRISQLPTEGIQYDMPWPIRKVPLKKAVRHIKYHPTSQTYVTITAVPDPFVVKDENNVAVHETAAGGGDTNTTMPTITPVPAPVTNGAAAAAADANGQPKPKSTSSTGGLFRPSSERQSLELVSPVTWETVDRYELQEYEIVTSIETVSLESTQAASGRKKFIAIGTSFIRGEDSTMRGTIYIFDIIDVVPEPDNPQTDHKLKLIYSEEVKGSVTALAALSGYLLTCVGTKVVVRSFEDNETLTGIAFIDVQIYVTSVKVVKNTIILADAYKSVWFVGFQDEPTKLVMLGKDYNPMEAMNVSYLIENQVLHIVVADSEKNIRLLQYAPFHVQSFSGQKLICRGDYHVGSQIQTTLSLPKIVLSGSDEGISHLTVAGTLDGGLCMVTPIPEKSSKRLALLSSQIVNGVQHPAGLNPRAYRLLQSKDRLNSNPVKGILDGDLLFEFVNLAANRQKEMTKQIGTSVDRVMDDLAAMAVAADHF